MRRGGVLAPYYNRKIYGFLTSLFFNDSEHRQTLSASDRARAPLPHFLRASPRCLGQGVSPLTTPLRAELLSRTGCEPPYHTRKFGRHSAAYASNPKNLSSTLSVSDEANLLTTLTEQAIKLKV